MNRLFFSLLCLVGLLISGPMPTAFGQSWPSVNEEKITDPVVAKKTAKRKPAKPKWNAILDLTHSAPFHKDAPPNSAGTLALRYAPQPRHSLRVSQTAVKYYEISEGDREVQAADTVMGYRYQLAKKLLQSDIGFDSTLPISESSKHNGVVTKSTLSLGISKSFGGDFFTIGMRPFYSYFTNEYKTSPASDEDGGDPLPWQQYGASANLGFTFAKIWSLSAGGSYSRLAYEDTKYTNKDDLSKTNQADHHYSIDVSAGVQPIKMLGFAVGYNQSNQLDRYGRPELLLYDAEASLWYGSVTVSL